MYESFYHLQTNPFSLVPDPHFCFSHTGHRQAREYLEYALKLGEGMVMVTGRPGTGKTTLVESFLCNLNMDSVTGARIAASRLDSKDLLRAVAYKFAIEAEGHDKATLRHLISRYLETQAQHGRRVLLIIDEAQGLPRSALDELRLLADLQTDSQQMLQLFLVGQESLHEQMLDPEMEYFQQRVIANYHLVPLDLQETHSYIDYRLRQAGWQGDPEMTGAAVVEIFRFSNGVPRHINKLCNRLLLLGYALGSHTLDREQVQTIISEMGAEQLIPVADKESLREAGAEISDGSALPQERLSELAIRMNEPLSARLVTSPQSAAVNDMPTTNQLAGEDIDELFESGDLSVPATVLRLPLHIRGKRKAAVSGWQPVSAASLVIVTVAVLTFAAMTGIVEKDAGEPLAMMAGEPQYLHAKQPKPDQLDGFSAATDTQPGQSINVSEGNLLQQVINDELPATAVGGLSSDAAMSTDVQSDTPLQGLRSFVSQADYIDYLLEQGHQALMENRLLTPALNSAYYYFQGVLRLTPGNRVAARGVEQIVERYVLLTNKALQQQDGIMANRYIARGLSIQPGNSELLALKEKSPVHILEQGGEEPVLSSRQTFGQLLSPIKTHSMNASTAQPDTSASYYVTSTVLYK